MKTKKLIAPILTLLLSLFVFPAFSGLNDYRVKAQEFDLGGLDFGGFNLISVEEEIKMGKEISAEVEKEHPLYRDSTVQNYIRELGNKLAPYSPNEAGIPLTVKVINDDEVNAFTTPGGYIYINSGLIKRVNNEAELVGVICHEMGHAVKRHGTQQLTRIYGLTFLMNIVLGGDAPDWQYIMADLFSSMGLLSYGRSAEYEADKLAVWIASAAGYDPNAYLGFMYSLLEMENTEPNLLTQLFSTHPDTQSRIDVITQEIAKLQAPQKKPITNTKKFNSIKKRIR